MTNLQVTVPDAVHNFIHEQIAAGRYTSPSELVTALVEDAQRRQAQTALAEKIREGLDSGPGIPLTDEWRQRERERLLATLPPGSLE